MKKRVITALVMIVLFVPLIIFDTKFTRIGYFIVASLFCGVAGHEVIYAMYKKDPTLKLYLVLVPIFTLILGASALASTYYISVVVSEMVVGIICYVFTFALLVLFSLVILLLMIFTKNSNANGMMGCVFTLVYCGVLLGNTFSLRYYQTTVLNTTGIINFTGIKAFLYVYLIVATTDIFAYVFGRKLGRHKLCPNISPNKSVEGSLFGLLFGTISGVAVLFLAKILTPETALELVIEIILAIVASASISVLVQIGDLVESKIKRTFEVKDLGYIFPGHGGVLDRFDSFLFAGCWFYLLMQIAQFLYYLLR